MKSFEALCLAAVVAMNFIPLPVQADIRPTDQYILDTFVLIANLAKFQDMLWFISTKVGSEERDRIDDTMQVVRGSFPAPQMVITNNSDIRIIETDAKKIYMGIVFTTGPEDPILDVHSLVLTGRHSAANLLISTRNVEDYQIIEDYTDGMSARKFQFAMVLTPYANGTFSLWGYTPYPEHQVDNRTDIFRYLFSSMSNFQSGGMNAKGHKFYSPLRTDVPYVFDYISHGRREFRGISYRMMELFIEYINAQLLPLEMTPDAHGGTAIDMREALQLVRDGKVEFVAHAYALYAIDERVDKSFPIMVVRWCLMVPVWNKVSTYFYAIQPFDVVVWYTVAATYLVLVVTNSLWVLWQHHLNIPARSTVVDRVISTILDDFCFAINISTGRTLKTPAKVIRAVLLLSVFFYGFFLAANYSSVLGSILTVTLFHSDINTMEDLIRTNISVMIVDYEYDFLLESNYDLPPEFTRLIVPVDVATFNEHQLAFNTSYAYFVTDDKWHFLRLQQADLKYGLFQFTDICFGSHHLAYPIAKDSSVWRSLEYYIFRMHSSGILQFFESTSFTHAVHAGLMSRLTESSEYTSAGMKHLLGVFMVLGGLYLISILCFLGELLWHKRCQCNSRRKREAMKVPEPDKTRNHVA